MAAEKDVVIIPAGGESTTDKSGDDASAREEKHVDDSNAEKEVTEKTSIVCVNSTAGGDTRPDPDNAKDTHAALAEDPPRLLSRLAVRL